MFERERGDLPARGGRGVAVGTEVELHAVRALEPRPHDRVHLQSGEKVRLQSGEKSVHLKVSFLRSVSVNEVYYTI